MCARGSVKRLHETHDGFNHWVGKIPLEEENDSLLQHSCLGNPVDRGAWRAIPHGGDSKSRTRPSN